MLKNRTRAILVGIFILAAYGVLVSGATNSKVVVMVADVVSGLAVIGIATLMFPFFKVFNKKISLTYLLLKVLEGSLMVIGGTLFLFDSLQFMRGWIYDNVHIYTFIVGGFIFYYLLYKTKIIPKFISVWGAIAISALTLTTLLRLIGLHNPALDMLLILIVTNEVFLAVWLIVKGFKLPKNS